MDLQALIDASSGPLELDPSDVFRPENTLRFTDREIEITGGAQVIPASSGEQFEPVFSMRNVSGSIDVNLVGDKNPAAKYRPKVEGHAGYWLMGCHDLTLSGSVEHVSGDAIYAGAVRIGGHHSIPCSGITVDLRANDMGRHGIAAVGVGSRDDGTAGMTIRKTSRFSNWHRLAIDYEFMGGWRTKRSDVVDEGATWIRREAT